MKNPALHQAFSAEFRGRLLERFLRYAAIGTQSDRHAAGEKTPSTDCQWKLIRILEKELRECGIADVTVNAEGFLVARLPSNLPRPSSVPCVGFIAHVDTAADVPGTDVRPRVHENYDGLPIRLEDGVVLDPADNPRLSRFAGDTIVTSDGTTLLGADDKAGIAAIVSAAEYLAAHPEIPCGEIEFIFTPDEETGKGMDRFPMELIRSKAAYTLDGDGEGTVEAECFNAYRLDVKFTGRVIHIGHARGRLANAVAMAAMFVGLLPRSESPEATDGRFGYYCPMEIKGSLEEASVEVYLRDFEAADIRRRIDAAKAFAAAVEAAFPGGRVVVTEEKQYLNMRDAFRADQRVVAFLDEAVRAAGIEPVYKSIRGGTDGARLSERGIPTPNIFAGGENFHSRTEWAALSAMTRAAETVVNLARIWGGA
jgi:tripeptide aminopeptidase